MARADHSKTRVPEVTPAEQREELIMSLISHISRKEGEKVFAFRGNGGRGDVYKVEAPLFRPKPGAELVININAARTLINREMDASALPTF